MGLKWFIVMMLALVLSACEVLNAPDTPATLRAENTAYSVEATSIPLTYAADQAMIQGTAAVDGTRIAELSSINHQLILTARAVIPPTPRRQVGTVTSNGNGTPNPDAGKFTNTGVATSVRESDGCADSFETQISQDAPAIYVNTRAVSVQGGTIMGVEWSANGQVVAEETWTVPRDETNFCIWFNLDPAKVPFTPGLWVVRLSADGAPIDPEVQFTIVGTASGSG